MVTTDYTYTVGDTVTTSNTWDTNSSSNITVGTTSCTVWGCACNGWHYYPYIASYPAPIKLYQIFCPKPGCTGKFWAEIDEIKKCPICKKTIKITDKPSPDYEVEVTK